MELVKAILEAELLLEHELSPTVLMMVLMQLEPLPHPYEPPVKTEMKVQHLAQNAAAGLELSRRVLAILLELQMSQQWWKLDGEWPDTAGMDQYSH